MILKDLITGAKPGAKVEIHVLNATEDMLHSGEVLLNKEIEGLDMKFVGDRLHLFIWLKEKVSFSIEMED